MTVVQEITIVWHKSERGGEGSESRTDNIFKKPLEKAPSKADECLYERKVFYQRDKKICTPEGYFGESGRNRYGKREYESPVLVSRLKVKNIGIEDTEKGIEISFSYDPQINGKPCRMGHNKDYNNTESRFYGRDILNERAFVLDKGQKGQIVYNGRFTDYDTGQWWYEQTAVNIANIPFEGFNRNIFVNSDFDFVYKQLEILK